LISVDPTDILGTPVMAGVGLPFLLVQVKSREGLRSAQPDLQAFELFKVRLEKCFGMIHIYFIRDREQLTSTDTIYDSESIKDMELSADVFARMFCQLNGGP